MAVGNSVRPSDPQTLRPSDLQTKKAASLQLLFLRLLLLPFPYRIGKKQHKQAEGKSAYTGKQVDIHIE